jgi:hypothetical protein
VPTLLAVPILLFVLMLQTIIVSTLPLLSGYADLMLVVLVAWGLQERVKNAWVWALVASGMVAYISALPFFVPVAGYLLVMAVARTIRRRVWQIPVLAMFMVTFIGSILYQGLALGILVIGGSNLSLLDSLNLVILPGTLVNLVLALPVHALVVDLAHWVYPEEVEV